VQAEQAGRLCRHAVHGDQLLLLADRVEKAQRVRAEAEHANGAEREQAEHGSPGDLAAFAPARRRQHEERQHQPGGHLDADADDERSGGGAKARARASSQSQGRREHHHDQRVVVRAADCEHEQHGIQPDERGGPAARVPQLAGRPCNQGDRGKTRGDGERLERPQAARQAERGGGVAGEREQRPVGGVLVGPADEPEDFVAGGLRRHVRVRVQAVQRAEAGEAQVAKDVLGEQRRSQQ
jgi:hypothetical protein